MFHDRAKLSHRTCSSQKFSIGTKTNCVDRKVTFCEDSQQLSSRYTPHSDRSVGGTSREIIAVWMKCDALRMNENVSNHLQQVTKISYIDILSVTGVNFNRELSFI